MRKAMKHEHTKDDYDSRMADITKCWKPNDTSKELEKLKKAFEEC